MAVDILLDKINKYAEAKQEEHNNKVNNELDLRKQYSNKIKDMADRIADLVKIGNALKEVKLPDTNSCNPLLVSLSEKLKLKNISLRYMYGVKTHRNQKTDADRKNEDTIVAIGFVNETRFSEALRFFAYPNGNTSYLRINADHTHGSYWAEDNDYPITSKVLLKFLTEFDNFEKAVMNFVTNLEV